VQDLLIAGGDEGDADGPLVMRLALEPVGVELGLEVVVKMQAPDVDLEVLRTYGQACVRCVAGRLGAPVEPIEHQIRRGVGK